jgi:hypothetical protein
MSCGSTLFNEFGNRYRLESPYYLECGEIQEFQYLTERRVWHTVHRCSWDSILVILNIRLLQVMAPVMNGIKPDIDVEQLQFICKNENVYFK